MQPVDLRRYLDGPEGRWAFRRERLHLANGLTLGGGALERDPWEREILDAIDAPGRRVAMIVGTRGIGKTELLGALAVERLVLIQGHRIVAVANDGDQARLLHDAAAGFVKRDPLLARVCEVQRDRIINHHTGSELWVATSDAVSSYGLGGHPGGTTFCFDELWGAADRDLLDSLLSALPKHPMNQLLVATNAGFVDGVEHELWKLCTESGDPALWAWDSFAAGVWPSWMDPEERERMKRVLPPSVYARLYENKRTSGSGDFATQEQVDRCVDERLDAHSLTFDYARRYIGVDLGLKHDRSVVAVVHKERETVVVDHLATFFGSVEEPVSLEGVFAYIAMLKRRIPRIRRVLLDPWQGAMLLERLRRLGLPADEFPFTTQRIQLLSQSLLAAVRSAQLRIPPHAHLAEELVRARVVERRYGWRVDHQSGGFSDHLIAVGLALVASLADAGGEFASDDVRTDLLLGHFLGRVRDRRRFGFARHTGLMRSESILPFFAPSDCRPSMISQGEEIAAEIRLTQVLERAGRMSSPEAQTNLHDLRRELEADRMLAECTFDTDLFDGLGVARELGTLRAWYEGAQESNVATVAEATHEEVTV